MVFYKYNIIKNIIEYKSWNIFRYSCSFNQLLIIYGTFDALFIFFDNVLKVYSLKMIYSKLSYNINLKSMENTDDPDKYLKIIRKVGVIILIMMTLASLWRLIIKQDDYGLYVILGLCLLTGKLKFSNI